MLDGTVLAVFPLALVRQGLAYHNAGRYHWDFDGSVYLYKNAQIYGLCANVPCPRNPSTIQNRGATKMDDYIVEFIDFDEIIILE